MDFIQIELESSGVGECKSVYEVEPTCQVGVGKQRDIRSIEGRDRAVTLYDSNRNMSNKV